MEIPATLDKGIPTDTVAALKAATERNPALLAAIENVRSADRSARTRNAAYQPRLDFRVRSENGNNLFGSAGTTHNNVAEVVMSWNLFNGMSDMARVRQYAEQFNVARDQRDKTCRDLRQTLLIAYNDTRKLSEQLTYLDQHQLSIEKARDAYRKQFDIGQRTLLDVLDTENELFQSRRAYVNADYDLRTAYARAHAGIGTLFQALGLSRLPTEPLPAIESEPAAAEACPPEGPQAYAVDKAALNARAEELVREAAREAQEAAQSPAAPTEPASRTIPQSRTTPYLPGMQVPRISPPPPATPGAPGTPVR
jgi:adhesin transport system outer membrane protein